MTLKHTHIVYLFFLIFTFQALGQSSAQMMDKSMDLDVMPQEEVFVHFSSPLVFSGEYFHYKLYNVNTSTNQLSSLSKVAYVELVSKFKNTVFKQKVRLENGLGKGDFFVPVDLTSGSYKLLAYTQWMKNGGPNYFFQADVNIINPYRNDQPLNTSNEHKIELAANGLFKNDPSAGLELDKEKYGKRKKVQLTVRSSELSSMAGNYSVNVRKVRLVNTSLVRPTSADRRAMFKNKRNLSSNATPKYLPELRGELLIGVVRKKETNEVAKDIKVTMSIPGATPILKVVNSNKDGMFFFNIAEEYDTDTALFQVLGAEKDTYSIELLPHQSVDYSSLQFPEVSIDAAINTEILQRSVYNQIENAYFEVKPDTIKTAAPSVNFFGTTGITYDLNDFSRFKTIKETFIEIIEDAWTRKEDGKTYFVVRPLEYAAETYFEPLTIVDGLIVQDPEALLNLSSKKVQTITIVRDKYYLGAKVYQGVIFVKTIQENFHEVAGDTAIQKVPLFTAQQDKVYFSQEYGAKNESLERIPDFRNMLLWMPDLTVHAENKTVDFYTSDNSGIFEIALEGYKTDGTAVSIKKYFEVE